MGGLGDGRVAFPCGVVSMSGESGYEKVEGVAVVVRDETHHAPSRRVDYSSLCD